MSFEYEKVVTPRGGLRLHLNENTAGCSPKVLAALHALTREQAALYPDYDEVVASVTSRFGVRAEEVVLTNGLDEGILAACVAALRRDRLLPFHRMTERAEAGASQPKAVIVVPAFDMYAACIDVVGGKVVRVQLEKDFSFPFARLTKAIGPETRLIFLTTPNNPTGQVIARQQILTLARNAGHCLVFVDEAYADFAGETLLSDPEARSLKNVVIGRTFAKAHGLAGLRAGAVFGHPDTLAALRRAVPPFSLNVCAAVALSAALQDVEYYQWYVAQVKASRALLYAALTRLGLRHWPSEANFVLIDFGADAARVVEALAARQVYVRDRSGDRASRGCVRVTAGVVRHTEAFIEALEEVLCGAA
jgi:histidinol-phosphate aminotransferase